MKKVILIGAGQTGRGYLARLLSLSGQPFVFLDKNEALIGGASKRGSYKISFGDSEREPLELKVSEACVMGLCGSGGGACRCGFHFYIHCGAEPAAIDSGFAAGSPGTDKTGALEADYL